MKDCIIVIPVYRIPTANEDKSIKNTLSKLKGYDCTFVIPENLDEYEGNKGASAKLFRDYPSVTHTVVRRNWLGPGIGVQGYNEMMLSKSFYEQFMNYKYVLICHPDVWIFRNELQEWLDKDYDIVAAPWIERPRFFSRSYLKTKWPFFYIYHFLYKRFPSIDKTPQNRKGNIGNGGFSLRKVSSILNVCDKYSEIIKEYISTEDEREHNEDVFWARVPVELKYPTQYEALNFSIDFHPKLCYRLNNCNLPMACHGYAQRKKRRRFWGRFIDLSE